MCWENNRRLLRGIARIDHRIRLWYRSIIGISSPPFSKQIAKAIPDPLRLARPKQDEQYDDDGQRNRSDPKHPLLSVHVADVVRVHTEDASDGAEGEENDSHNGEGVDCGLLVVFIGVDTLDILETVD